ncbi:hypothetical protein H6P81_001765 [Aristolochia fimbriata]|uniref:Fatty acyl-CoA reductase n=1 Tax=Aristolochia fimbriata TaxID=158543 RepID=A0AAV7FB29_ARIFI|nr:hypothetical protein H6P81_001765 [Aristolochia fimbriata]
MECNRNIAEFLDGKSILVTGSTGYLAKIFVEKVLRIQPQVKMIYLLLRANDTVAATRRLETQVLGADLFKLLRETHGETFNSFISSKVSPIRGNISLENLGIDNSGLREQLFNELDVIINSAANTKFDERYDVALGTNTFGAKNIVEFAKKCVKLGMLLHVSTAFVAGEKAGVIPERPFCMGEALNIGTSTLDPYAELKLMEIKLKQLQDKGVTEERKTIAMKELGLQRAAYFGWPNTYVFTKAMGEMLMGHLRDSVPLVIVRPSIVTSTYLEPFPGWIENTRTIDSLLVAYALGKLKCFIADPTAIVDVIPGDMVVNAIIRLSAAHFCKSSVHIYHMCSSMRNPPNYFKLRDWFYQYFSKHPHIGNDGKPIKVRMGSLMTSMASFNKYMNLHYKLPLEVFSIINRATCRLFSYQYNRLNKKYNYAMRAASLYKPYVFFKGRFDDSNSEWLRVGSSDDSERLLYYRIQDINWEYYFMSVHIPGVVKYLVK